MTDTKPTMNTDKVNALWVKASDDAEGMRLGYTMQHHYFAALIQQQMEAENAELRKDAERLNWLEGNTNANFSYEICSLEFPFNDDDAEYECLRDLIDAAIDRGLESY